MMKSPLSTSTEFLWRSENCRYEIPQFLSHEFRNVNLNSFDFQESCFSTQLESGESVVPRQVCSIHICLIRSTRVNKPVDIVKHICDIEDPAHGILSFEDSFFDSTMKPGIHRFHGRVRWSPI